MFYAFVRTYGEFAEVKRVWNKSLREEWVTHFFLNTCFPQVSQFSA
jgi:hypothetical protein